MTLDYNDIIPRGYGVRVKLEFAAVEVESRERNNVFGLYFPSRMNYDKQKYPPPSPPPLYVHTKCISDE